MPRSVRTFLPVVGDPDALVAAFDDDPERWLPNARSEGGGVYRFAATAHALARPVRCVVGAPWRHGDTMWRSLTWDPVDADGSPGTLDRLLPSLDGELGLHTTSRGRTTLVLDARYRPPGGAVGAAADAIALGRVARSTIEHVVAEVAARLGAEAILRQGSPVGAA